MVGPVSTIPGTDTLGPDGSEAVSSPFPQPTVSGDNLEMLIIGHDDNVKKKSMKDLTDQKMVCKFSESHCLLSNHLVIQFQKCFPNACP